MYFKITKTSYAAEHSDAYEIDIGYNTSTIVRSFSIEQNENFSLYYDYQSDIHSDYYEYTDRQQRKEIIGMYIEKTISQMSEKTRVGIIGCGGIGVLVSHVGDVDIQRFKVILQGLIVLADGVVNDTYVVVDVGGIWVYVA